MLFILTILKMDQKHSLRQILGITIIAFINDEERYRKMPLGELPTLFSRLSTY